MVIGGAMFNTVNQKIEMESQSQKIQSFSSIFRVHV